jgi:hypothetical protein
MDLRVASEDAVTDALDRFYFLDPFVKTKVNVFLLLQPSATVELIPNEVGRAYSPTEVVIPDVEVWYPGRLPAAEISRAIRVPLKRPGKFDHIDFATFAELFG